jgi:glucose-1-phosphate adenylyltransferase
LHQHIYNTYKFDPFSGGFVEILAAQQTMQYESWYQGTADAVRRNIPHFTDKSYDLVLILSGDQLYRMNFQDMIRTHLENKAVVTIAALPVAEEEAKACGIMRIQADGRIIEFEEKPKTQEKLARVRTDPAWLESFGLKAKGRPYLASMGIYLFNAKALVEILERSDSTDFGHEILPQTIAKDRVQAHLFDGYWEDIGTVGAFHKANLDLTSDVPAFDFTFGDQPIFTRPRYLPCSKINGATIRNSLVSDGCVIGRGTVIENSVIGVRSIIGENATIRDSYLMGLDYYEQGRHLDENKRLGIPNSGVGAGSVIERAIIDKNVRIGPRVRIVNDTGIIDSEELPTHVIRDGVTVIPKGMTLRDGLTI